MDIPYGKAMKAAAEQQIKDAGASAAPAAGGGMPAAPPADSGSDTGAEPE
jgi:hypothetical protein